MKTIYFFPALLFVLLLNINSQAQSQLTADAGINQSICFGDSVVLGGSPTATGGTAPYTYSWSPSSGTSYPDSANPVVTPVTTTTYSLTVTDNIGSTSTSSVVITVYPLPAVEAGSDVTICYGDCIQLIASGGIIYNWSPASDINNTNISNPIVCPPVTTTYTVTVIGANGCSATDDVTVFVTPQLIAVLTASPATCDSCNGTITADISGGSAPYTYIWSPSGTMGSTITDLCPGSYTVTVTDGMGCTVTANAIVANISSPPVIIVSSTNANDTLCDGTATVTPTGGTPPYTYLWSNEETTATITDLCSGTYVVIVTDSNGCVSIDTVVISTVSGFSEFLTSTNNIKLFPNPFSNAFTVEIISKEDYPCEITIYSNLSGVVQTVSLTGTKNIITTGDWSKGFYYYILKNKNGKIIGKGKMIMQ